MRQVIIFIFIFLIAMFFLGCSEEPVTSKMPVQTPISTQHNTSVPIPTRNIKTNEKVQPDYNEYIKKLQDLNIDSINKVMIFTGISMDPFESENRELISRWVQFLKKMRMTPMIDPDRTGNGYVLYMESNNKKIYLGTFWCFNEIIISNNTIVQIDNYYELQYELMELERLTTGQVLSTEMTR